MRDRAPMLLILFLLLTVSDAFAHDVDAAPVDLDAWWWAWSWQPLPLVGIIIASVIYTVGLMRLWRNAGRGRGVARWQGGCFAAGIGVLLLALISPIDTLSGQLNWVHMVQHTMLMMIAAPLLVAGSPAVVSAWALPQRWGRTIGRGFRSVGVPLASRYLLWQPIIAWVLYAVILWIWHLPTLYNLALRSQLVHDVQHLAFLLGACLYWRVVVDPLGRVRLTPPLAVLYLFTMSLQGMFLGVFMAFSPQLWYAEYATTTQPWGLSPLMDQQIAGYIMWKPACAIYALVAAIIFGMWLHRSIRRDQTVTLD